MPLSPFPKNKKILVYGSPKEVDFLGLLNEEHSHHDYVKYVDQHSTWEVNFDRIYFLPSILKNITARKLAELSIGKLNNKISSCVNVISLSNFVLPEIDSNDLGLSHIALSNFTIANINYKQSKLNVSNIANKTDLESENNAWRCLVEKQAAAKYKGSCVIL